MGGLVGWLWEVVVAMEGVGGKGGWCRVAYTMYRYLSFKTVSACRLIVSTSSLLPYRH